MKSRQKADTGAHLRPTTSIVATEGGGYTGRLGFLFREDAVGNLIAFTAAQVGGQVVKSVESDSTIARAPNWVTSEISGESEHSADAMLVPLSIDSKCRLADVQVRGVQGEPLYSTDIENDPIRLLGRTVLVHTRPDRGTRARIMGTRGHFIMPAGPSQKLTLFTNALVLERDDNKPISREGDAGALVTTEEGTAVGIVVCGAKGTSFAAPLSGTIRRFLSDRGGFTGLSRDFVKAWNTRHEQGSSSFGHLKLPPDTVEDAELARTIERIVIDEQGELTPEIVNKIREAFF